MIETNAKKIYDLVGAEAVFTAKLDLRQYLTGFQSSFGYVISDKEGTTFYTDTRYLEGAQKLLQNTDISVKVLERGKTAYDLLKKYKEVAIPISKTYAPEYEELKSMGIKLVDSLPAFTKAMAIKSQSEITKITKACEITDKAYVEMLSRFKEGMTENEAAAELEYLMRKFGASGTSFETIMAFGENGSVPHHETGMRKLKFGDSILIDFGCKVGGYCSDCTRTLMFGDDNNHEDFKTAYNQVLNAHNIAKEKITENITGHQADAFAREELKKHGLDKYFTHSLGHGIGINVHEFPRLTPNSQDVLQNGMVFSDEPGVYFAGEFGIRIEDTVTLKDGAVKSLTTSDKKLLIL
ncbi:MAG: aminopeptidase P family protein [Clostridiales bacterium]|nr:aminopeptidase P family protein [Clostridiales bacterium]